MKKLVFSCIVIHSLIAGNTTTHNLHNYFMANYDQFKGNMQRSYERYKSLISDSAPIYSYKGYVHLLFDTGNYAHIEQLIPQLDRLFEKDQTIQFIFAQTLEKLGKFDQADDRYIKLNDQFKNNQEIAFNTVNSYLRRKEPENAIKVIDSLLNTSGNKPNNFIFYFLKAQINMQLNNKEEALKNVQKSLDMHPRFEKGWLLYALLHEQAGELANAIKGYTNFLENTGGNNQEVEQHLLQLVFKLKIQQRNLNQSITINKQCFEQALNFFEKKKYKEALTQIDACLKEKPDSDQSKLLKIQILSALKQHDTLIDLLSAWIIEKPEQTIWYKTVHLLTQDTLTFDNALNILKNVESKHPKNILPQLYIADLAARFNKNDIAQRYLEKSLNLTTTQSLQSKILYQLGLINFEEKNHESFKKVIAKAHEINSNFGPLLNIIAYYYATDGNNLKEAESFAQKALKQNPEDSHYLDTQALILMKQQKYTEALVLLEKVAQKIPSDYTVLVHLAQSQYENGQQQKALTTLEQAKRNALTKEHNLECTQLLSQWKSKKTSQSIASVLSPVNRVGTYFRVSR